MAIEPVGTLLTVTATADSGSTSITVPEDADAVYISVGGYVSGGSVANKLDGATITIGGVAVPYRSGAISATGGDLSGSYGGAGIPTGTQTLAWNWEGSSTWAEGGTLLIRFLKGVDQLDPVRAAAGAGTQSTSATQNVATASLDAEPGDYLGVGASAWSSTLGSFTGWGVGITEVHDATFNAFRLGFGEAYPLEGARTASATYNSGGSGDRTLAISAIVFRAAPPQVPEAFGGVVAATSDFAFGDFGAVSQQFQRRVFTDKARGHDYLMFQDDAAAWLTMSSDNGASWTTPHKLFDMPTDASLSLTTSIAYTAMHWDQDHEKLHVCWGFVGDDNPTHLQYRRGTLVGDGTVSWDAAAQNAFTGQGSLLEMSISTDSDGVPWITFEFFNDGSPPDHPKPWVVKNSGANATWTTASGFPFKLSDDSSHWWTGVGRANDSGGMWVFYWNDRYFMEGDAGSRSWAFARLWLPSGGWQTEIEIDLDRADITGQGSLPDVCYATDPDSGIAYFAWNDTFDAPKFWRSNEGVTYDMPPVYPETMAMGVDKATGHVYLVTHDPFNMSLDYWWFDSSLGYWEQGNVPLNVNFPLHSSMSITEYSDRILVAVQDMAFTGDHDVVVACVLAGADDRTPGGDDRAVTGTIVLLLSATGGVQKAAGAAGALNLGLVASDDAEKGGETDGGIALATTISSVAEKLGATIGEVVMELGLEGAVEAAASEDKETAGSIDLELLMSAVAAKSADASAALALAITLAGDATKAASVAAALDMNFDLAAEVDAVGEGQVSGELALNLALAAVAVKAASTAASLPTTLLLNGAAVKAATTAGSLGLVLSLSGAASVTGPRDAPSVKLPTTVEIGAWLATVVIPPNAQTVEVTARVLQAVLEANGAKSVEVTGNLGTVEITPNTKTVEVTPYNATVEIE